jgi:hypothetical protein
MKKYIFITPEGLTYKPNSDSPNPDFVNLQIFDFYRGSSVQDTLSDLIEFNVNPVENRADGPYSLRIESNNRRNLWLREHRSKIAIAS